MKKLFNVRVFFIMFAVITFSLAISINNVNAKPPGIKGDLSVGKMIKKFNVISLPEYSGWSDSNASCNGARIFFQEDNGNTLGTILWKLFPDINPNFSIYDCDGTDGGAEIWVDEGMEFYVFIRVLGKAGKELDLVCENKIFSDDDEDLCLIDEVTLTKSKAFTKIMSNIFDDEYEEVLWTLDGDWKIFEVRLYEINTN